MVRRIKLNVKGEKYRLSLPELKIKTVRKLVNFGIKVCRWEENNADKTVDALLVISGFLDDIIKDLNRIDPFTLLDVQDGNTAITVELR